MVGDGYESEVTDAILRGEIELLADVMAAAAQVDGRFTTAQLDDVLGLATQEFSSWNAQSMRSEYAMAILILILTTARDR